MIDNTNFTDTDADLLFIAVNANKSEVKNETTPRNSRIKLCRFEFLEILIKVAIARFYTSHTVKSEQEAIEKLFMEHLEKHFHH
jgi:hypothetical protein